MNHDELAWVNQQLAGMLTAGLPLEGALKQVCQSMRRGRLRTELERLEAALAQGTPLDRALAEARLPGFYVAMLRAGAGSNNLPGVLTLLGDYYQQLHGTWTRLKGLMVYPVLVLVTSMILSGVLAWTFTSVFLAEAGSLRELGVAASEVVPPALLISLWLPVILVTAVTIAVLLVLLLPAWRQWLQWKLPMFREASLSQFASAFALMLRQGCQPRDALDLLRRLEAGRPLGRELGSWQERLAAGHTRFSDMAAGGRIVPPLFVWLVASAGEHWEAGFRKAAEIYQRRAAHHIEVTLYAALPVMILSLGLMIVVQVGPFLLGFLRLFESLGA
ncbi:MAG: type II secretion system F family protein [Verrucomicrobia bacterium]|nr:type II secretion system F family protein [Verrucomicrobiota bacterium]